MVTKKMTRKELLKGPDEFITFTAKVVGFYKEHVRIFKYIGYSIAGIIVLYVAINFLIGSINKKGQNSYNNASKALSEALKSDADVKKLAESEKMFQQVIDDYGFSTASKFAEPQLARIRYLNGKYDEAISIYKKFKDKISGNIIYVSLVEIAIASCHEAKGDMKAASDILSTQASLLDNPFREQAMLNLARVYKLSNKPGEAEKILKEFVTLFPESPSLPMVKASL